MRRRSVDNLLQELAIVKTKFKNLKEIFFVDEVFVLDRQWLFEFIDKYKQVNIPFQCEFYPTTVKEDIISKLKKIGLINVNMGIQSGSNRVRTEIYKRTTPDKVILNAAHIFKKHKIVPTYDIIVDNPYETKEDMEESTKFLLKLPRPYNLNIFSLIHFPKTELTEKFKSDRYITCSNSEKALKQWRMTFNVKRESANAHYNCLVSLLSKSFVPKPLIKSFSNSNYFKKNPSLLIYFVKFCNNLKLAITGIKLTLNGRMTLARIKRQIRTHKGVTN